VARVVGKISLKAATAAVHDAAGDGLHTAVEHLLGASVQLTPIETGALRASGVASVDKGSLRGAVSYNAPPYDVIQHEALGYRHDEGEAKFLESPLYGEAAAMAELIAAAIRRRF